MTIKTKNEKIRIKNKHLLKPQSRVQLFVLHHLVVLNQHGMLMNCLGKAIALTQCPITIIHERPALSMDRL